MNKLPLLFVFILSIFINGNCEITEFDKNFQANPAKGIEDIVILEEKGVIDHTFTTSLSKTSYSVKKKFFTKKAIEDYGTITLSYDASDENIGGIEGIVYLPNGETVKISKKDIHKKKVSKEWGYKEVEINIALPSLTEGAIVEYKYYVTFKGIEDITKWYFQNDYYTVKSEVKFIAWPTLRYGLTVANQIIEPKVTEAYKAGNKYFTFTRENIPAFKKEKYSFPSRARKEAVIFYYFDTDMKYKNYWVDRGKAIYKNRLKKHFKANGSAKKIIANNSLKGKDNAETIKKIFDYTMANYTSFSTLSKKQSAEIDKKYIKKLSKAKSVAQLLKFKYLYRYQINYILGALIKTAIPKSTIEYGYYIPFNKNFFNKYIKTYQQFTDELIKVKIGSEVYWLSPIKRLLPPNQLPSGAYGVQVLMVGPGGVKFEKIKTETCDKAISNISKDIYIGEEDITLKETYTYNKHTSYIKRKKLIYFNENELRDLFEKEVTNKYGEDAELVSFKLENLNDIYKPLIIKREVKYSNELDDSSEKLFVDLFGIDKYKDNPFNDKNRKQNIVFAYPNKSFYTINYHLPEGFKLSSIPKSIKINTQDLIYNMTFTKKADDLLELKIEDILQRNYYTKAANYFFKTSFDKIINAQNTKFIIEEVE